MTPAEREALKLAAQKATAGAWTNSRLSSLNIISESAQRTVASAFTHTVGGSSDDGHNARYIAAASPEVILHLLEFISSLELTLSNATAAGVKQLERIAALEESGKWISVQQEPPPEGEPLLIVWKGVGQHLTYMLYEGEWYPYHADPDDRWGIEDGLTTVTHWRELPAAPTEPTPALEEEKALTEKSLIAAMSA